MPPEENKNQDISQQDSARAEPAVVETPTPVVIKIPTGKTLSYMEVARMAGRPKAYRAVGNILNKNYDPRIPCHRVVRSDGSIGGYNRGEKKKTEILKQELYEHRSAVNRLV